MPQSDNPRLDSRNGEVWKLYVSGWTQQRIAARFDIGQQRVSEILAQVRAEIPESDRLDAALLAQERTDALLTAVWPEAMTGDAKAVAAALRVLERQAKALGTDAVQPLQVQMEQRLDLEAGVVADALGAALDALDLTAEQQQRALEAAQARLLGEEPPEPPAPADEPDPLAKHRAWLAAEGLDTDDDDGEDDDD